MWAEFIWPFGAWSEWMVGLFVSEKLKDSQPPLESNFSCTAFWEQLLWISALATLQKKKKKDLFKGEDVTWASAGGFNTK